MGNISRIYVEAKRSKNYQTQTVGIEMTVEVGDDKEELLKSLQLKVNALAVNALKELL